MYGRADVARYLYHEPRTEDDVRELLGRKLAMQAISAEGETLALAIVPRDLGSVVGDCVLTMTSEAHRQGEIGFVVHPDHQGRGYATEASRELLRIAFEDLGLHRVVGRLESRNAASSRVLEKLEMRREAHLIENEFVKGEWQSELVYAILDREWNAAEG